ncbi:MAG: serine/threonine protein kinase [Bdellovibrionales bacterium]|nr:serine/threonine protein kinase [Bdellovibrionales bacterium]
MNQDFSSTEQFYSLLPARVLDSVELCGVRATGRSLALNSLENRVYEVEIECEPSIDPYERFRVIKFYRPGRWSRDSILDEHGFLRELSDGDVEVVPPVVFPSDGETLHLLDPEQIWFAVYQKIGGRNLDELDRERLLQVGRTLARLHAIGSRKRALHRLDLSGETYVGESHRVLEETGAVPTHLRESYSSLISQAAEYAERYIDKKSFIRIHGDFHSGNILWIGERCKVVDFDDFVNGPPVQDIWLLTPGRDRETQDAREILLEGYEQMREFDRRSLVLVELLRAMRIIRFHGWIAKRWEDPSFPRLFTRFQLLEYWNEEMQAVRESLELFEEAVQLR